MGRTTEQIADVPCGNTVALVGVDQYILKSGPPLSISLLYSSGSKSESLALPASSSTPSAPSYPPCSTSTASCSCALSFSFLGSTSWYGVRLALLRKRGSDPASIIIAISSVENWEMAGVRGEDSVRELR